jgi:prepilin-type N-terminal cleavage/methylation domain-containing protein
MARGFTLIETLLALMVTTVALGAIAQLAVVATRANRGAARTSVMAMLASQKVEQLRGLAWTFDAAGAAVSDAGLGASGRTLADNVEGFFDVLDDRGRSRGGLMPSDGPLFIRRWSIEAIPLASDTLLITVVVMPLGEPGAVRLASLRTRKGP